MSKEINVQSLYEYTDCYISIINRFFNALNGINEEQLCTHVLPKCVNKLWNYTDILH